MTSLLSESTIKALEAGYLFALQTEGTLRVRNQATLCMLRDELARISGLTAQTIQEEFEARALEIKLK